MARPPRLGYGWPNSYDPVYLGSDDGRLINHGHFINANGRFIKGREGQ